MGRETENIRVDTNCQRKRITVPVTLVLGLREVRCVFNAQALEATPIDCFARAGMTQPTAVHALR
jgi:hypothetical protein